MSDRGHLLETEPPPFDFDVFERATAIVARNLCFFRTEDFDAEPSENEHLTAGHLVGGLAANGLLVSSLPTPAT